MSRLLRYGVATTMCAAALTAGALPAGAAQRWVVGPGQSIQAAVDRAHSGDTIVLKPGVYRENILVTKDRISIVGSGASAAGTVIEPPAKMRPAICDQLGGAGICVAGKVSRYPRVDAYVTGVTVRAVLVKHFVNGIVAVGARDAIFENNATMHTEEYGLARFASTGGGMRHNRATDAGEFGLYVGDSPHANAKVIGNTSSGSFGGIFLRNVRGVEVAYTTFTDNCAGMVLAGEPNGSDLNIHHNTIRGNNRVCPGGGGEPAIAGVGIVGFGISDSVIRANSILNNSSSASPLSAGLLLISEQAPEGTVLVERNTAFRNKVDIVVQGVTEGHLFRQNNCRTSMPKSICV